MKKRNLENPGNRRPSSGKRQKEGLVLPLLAGQRGISPNQSKRTEKHGGSLQDKDKEPFSKDHECFQIGWILTLQRGKQSFKPSHLPVHCHLLPTYVTWLHPCHPVLSQIRHRSSHCVCVSLSVSLPFCAHTHAHRMCMHTYTPQYQSLVQNNRSQFLSSFLLSQFDKSSCHF